jgi:LacI family transcriptional regulator
VEELSDYNVEIETFTFSTLDKKSFVSQSELILKGNFDGIVFSPSFHKQSLLFFEKCDQKNIPVIFIDSTIEGVEVKSYFGQNAVQSGYIAAKLMSYGVPKNSKVLLLSMANKMAITRHLKNREKGFLDFFDNAENPKKIKTLAVEIDPTENQEPDKSLARIFAENQDIEGVFVTNARVHQIAKYIHKNIDHSIFLGGYDLVGKNIKYLNRGVIDFLICQRPEDQGYKSVMAMFNYLLSKVPVNKVNYSPIDIVLKENVDVYTDI